MYPDKSWKETCGMLANLVADSGAGKGQRLSEERRVKNEESNGLSEDTQASSVGQSPTKPHVLVLLKQAFTLPSCSHVLLS